MRWLNENVATAAYNEVTAMPIPKDTLVLDVRDLVDKSGNDTAYINVKIEEGLKILAAGSKVIVCCDYGMSRSNSIAIGIIVKQSGMDFSSVVSMVKEKVDESGIKVEMLNTVYTALYGNQTKKTGTKNVLITGGNGFLGKQVAEKLAHSFTIVSPGSKEIDLINDTISLDLLVKSKNIDTIIHLANPKIFTTNKSMGDTLVMLKNVLDVCRTNQLKLIFLSGWEIYSGYKSNGIQADEFLAPNAKGTYGETKWLCELLIKQYINNYGLACQIIRSGPVYGAYGEKPKFIFNFIDKAFKHADIVTHKYLNGFPGLDLLYIDDLISLIAKAVQSNFTGDLNVGSGSVISTYEIAKIICHKIGSNSRILFTEINDYAPNIIMNEGLANKLFGWEPTITIEAGLEAVINNCKLKNI
jgi:UDP-glucuronate decarboxylase